jgi:outer membrane protein assembly factor BamB
LDGDGRVEVIAVRLGDSEGPEGREGERKGEKGKEGEGREVKQQPCLEVCKTNGELLWRKAWPADFACKYTLHKGGFAIMFVSVGRFTGRNPLDVVVSYTGEKAGGHTAVLDGATGATVWDLQELYPGMYGYCWDACPPVVFDYDGDGLDDLATVCQTVHYTILRGKDGQQLLDRPRDASNQGFGGEPSLFPGAWAVGAMLGGADADGDGRLELGIFSSQAAVGVSRASSEPLWFLNLPVVNQVPSPGCWADVDGDGKMEAAFILKDGFVRVYDGMTGTLRWEENLGALGSLVAADVDGDGADEILFSSEKGILYCLGDEAVPLTGSHVQWAREFEGVPGQAIFADVTGDGIGEILVPTADGYLYCLA